MNRKLKANKKLEFRDFQSNDVVSAAKGFLGCFLHTYINNKYTVSRIVETEAYSGSCDKACHAYKNKRTPRTAIMFSEGGIAYVYLIYGIHYLFNIVVNKKNNPDAVLVRAVEPVVGIETMMVRRGSTRSEKSLTNGPGKLTKAMGISGQHNGISLIDETIWITYGENLALAEIESSARINVEYAEEDALLPWRFYIKDNIYVSK